MKHVPLDEGQKAPLHDLPWPTIKDIQMVTRDVLLRNCTVVAALVTTPHPVVEGKLWTLTMAIVGPEILARVLTLGSESLKEAIRLYTSL